MGLPLPEPLQDLHRHALNYRTAVLGVDQMWQVLEKYAADQMRAHERAVAEECAKLADALANMSLPADPIHEGWTASAAQVAKNIRSRFCKDGA